MLYRNSLLKVAVDFVPYRQHKHIKISQDIKGHEVLPRITAPLQSGTHIQDLKNQLRIVMGQETGHRTNLIQDRENLNAYLVRKSTDLPPRTVQDSFLSAVIPLKSDVKLQEKYAAVTGDVRYGRLVEDIDIFSVMVAQKYILNPHIPIFDASPYTVVTVLVDSLIFNFLARPTVDIIISGHIANVGLSSAEVVVWLDQQFGHKHRNITKAKILVGIRDANNKNAAIINPLLVSNDKERNLVKDSKRQRTRSRRSLYELTNDFPTPKEQKALHEMALKTCGGSLCRVGRLPTGHSWMADTANSSSIIAFPDDRNIHNTIFGGYLMRHAVELAFATCFRFCNQQGKMRGVTEMRFYRSIPVGSILQLQGQVAFAKDRFLQVAMYADVLNKRDGLQQATNTFHVTIEVHHPVQNVVPKSYREAMLYLDAERRLERMKKHIHEPFHYIDYNHSPGSLH